MVYTSLVTNTRRRYNRLTFLPLWTFPFFPRSFTECFAGRKKLDIVGLSLQDKHVASRMRETSFNGWELFHWMLVSEHLKSNRSIDCNRLTIYDRRGKDSHKVVCGQSFSDLNRIVTNKGVLFKAHYALYIFSEILTVRVCQFQRAILLRVTSFMKAL